VKLGKALKFTDLVKDMKAKKERIEKGKCHHCGHQMTQEEKSCPKCGTGKVQGIGIAVNPF
jgi:primosomal protein N'